MLASIKVLTFAPVLGVALSAAGCANVDRLPDPKTTLRYYPGAGFVRGTPDVLAKLASPLQAIPGPNRTVAACRDAVESEALKLGALKVESVSAGPEKMHEQGQVLGRVRMRIIYDRGPNLFEVRQSDLICTMSPDGRITSLKAA